MRQTLRTLVAPLLGVSLLALVGEETLGHQHAFAEEDLAPHSLEVSDHSGHCVAGTHYDGAVEAHHDACPACALCASPSGPPPTLANVAGSSELLFRLSFADVVRHGVPGQRLTLARGPPLELRLHS